MGWLDDWLSVPSESVSNIGSSFYNAFADPYEKYQKELESNYIPGYSPIMAGARTISSGLGNVFGLIQEPVNVAANYYAGLPEALDPNTKPVGIAEIGGGSLRDLAAEGYLSPASAVGGLDYGKVTNPYTLKAIETIGGETLEELTDPTNVPGALVGIGGLLGKGAGNLDKIFAGMGAVSGLGEGIPQIAEASEKMVTEGVNPENFGQLLQGGIGAGFGGLSAAGLAAPTPSVTPSVPGLEIEQTLNQRLGLPEGFVLPGTLQLDINELIENATDVLPIQYDPTRLGMGFGGFKLRPSEVETAGQYNFGEVEPADIVHHGSPAVFEQFDTDKLLSGEGANVYGPGFYFAEAPGVAQYYAEALAADPYLTRPQQIANTAMAVTGNDMTLAIEQLMQALDLDPNGPSGIPPEVPRVRFDDLRSIQELEDEFGRMQVAFDPEIRRQAINIAGQLGDVSRAEYQQNLSGAEIADRLTPEEAIRLSEQGIAGVKYLDQQSRGAGEGSRNYVVFNPKDIKVIERKVILAKEELRDYVTQMKDKYGEKKWRQKMGLEENKKFDELRMNVQESPAPPDTAIKPPAPPAIPEGTFIPEGPEAPAPIIPPEPPTPPEVTEPPTPREPKPEPLQLTPLSRFERAAYSRERNIAKASPELGRLEKAYRQEHEVNTSRDIGTWHEAIQGLSKESVEKVLRFADGQKIVLNSKEAKAAEILRKLYDRIAVEAGAELGTRYRKDYYTHIFENAGPGEIGTRYGKEAKDKPYGPLEKERTKEGGEIIYDPAIVDRYLDFANRRIAEVKHFGKGLEKIQATGDPETVNYVVDYIKRLTGRSKPAGPVSRGLSTLRKVAALGDLTFTSLLQTGQGIHTASFTGLRNSTKAAIKVLLDYNKSELEALKGGALYPTISHEVGTAIGAPGYMHGVPTVDKWMRVHSFIAGRMLADDAIRGNSYARRMAKELGIDLKNIKDPKNIDLLGKKVADATQLRSDDAHLPGWVKTDAGKMAFQYLNFAYANTRFLKEMLKHPIKNMGQIARFAGVGMLGGEAILSGREALKALFPSEDEDEQLLARMMESAIGDESFEDKETIDKVKALFRSKRIPLSSPAWRSVQNLAGLGAGTIFQTLVDKVLSGRYRDLPLGPGGGLLSDILEAGYKDVSKTLSRFDISEPYLEDVSYKNLGKVGLSNLPIPFVSGRKIAGEVFPPERSGRMKIDIPKVSLPKVSF